VKVQIEGRSLIAGIPLVKIAELHAEGCPGEQPTICNLSKYFLHLDEAAFAEIGAFWTLLGSQRGIIVPPGYLLAEYPVAPLNLSFSYLSMTQKNSSPHQVHLMMAMFKLALSGCSQPSHEGTEQMLRELNLVLLKTRRRFVCFCRWLLLVYVSWEFVCVCQGLNLN
jgi:hypothetical protein